MEPIFTKVTGEYGTAEPNDIPDIPEAAETVSHWLLTSEKGVFHSLFDQWILFAVRLRDDVPGFPPPKRHFSGATHEILCITLNPEVGRYTTERIAQAMVRKPRLAYMEPPNVMVQVEATDDEVRDVVSLLAQAFTHGLVSPESMWTAGHDKALNERWMSMIVKSLAHARGEVHAP
jgi:hypothetical protein